LISAFEDHYDTSQQMEEC